MRCESVIFVLTPARDAGIPRNSTQRSAGQQYLPCPRRFCPSAHETFPPAPADRRQRARASPRVGDRALQPLSLSSFSLLDVITTVSVNQRLGAISTAPALPWRAPSSGRRTDG